MELNIVDTDFFNMDIDTDFLNIDFTVLDTLLNIDIDILEPLEIDLY